MKWIFLALTLLVLVWPNLAGNQEIVCASCTMILGLTEQVGLQIQLLDSLKADCDGSSICELAAQNLVYGLMEDLKPEDLCDDIGICYNAELGCALWEVWPVPKLPPAPPVWPTARRELDLKDSSESLFIKGKYDRSIDMTSLIPSLDGSKALDKLPLPQLAERNMNLGKMMTLVLSSLSSSSLQTEENQSKGRFSHLSKCGRDMECIVMELEKMVNEGKPVGEDDTPINPCGHNISCQITRIFDEHLPLVDTDGDAYSPPEYPVLRGSDWRGADCDDTNADIYPGRKTPQEDANIDHNCNGIYGSNETGTFEEQFCDVEQRGVMFLGDSATAHFHIPPSWLTAEGYHGWDDVETVLLNEFDCPRCAWGTSHAQLTENGDENCPFVPDYPPGLDAVESIYSFYLKRNRCAHRDFQNIGVNGERVTSSMQSVNSAARDQENDHPVTAFYALIGNDVCNGHTDDTFGHMTPPDKFKSSVLEALDNLDTFLPAGSHVILIALVDGRVLYDTLYQSQHPLGMIYPTMYEYLNCYDINPCYGWLNTNETIRDMTTAWAKSLNAMYQEIIQTESYENFELIYMNPDWQWYFDTWEEIGKDPKDLIEPVDGFHPSQTGNVMLAESLWKNLVELYPQAAGPINPHNDEILDMFGDQGGY